MFKRLIVTSIVVGAFGTGSLAMAAVNEMLVNVQPASSVDVALYADGIDGRVLTTTDASGRGSIDIEFANSPKGQRGHVVKCGDKRVAIVMDGSRAPKNCSNKELAVLLWGDTRAINVNMPGGMGVGTKVAIAAGAAGAVLVAKEVFGGHDQTTSQHSEVTIPKTSTTTSTSTTSTTSTTASQPPASQPPPPSVADLFGTFNFTAVRTMDTGCNFVPTFQGSLQLSGSTDGSKVTARLIERLTREYAGMMRKDGTFNGSGSFQAYTTSIEGQVSGNRVHFVETLIGPNGCRVAYDANGNK